MRAWVSKRPTRGRGPAGLCRAGAGLPLSGARRRAWTKGAPRAPGCPRQAGRPRGRRARVCVVGHEYIRDSGLPRGGTPGRTTGSKRRLRGAAAGTGPRGSGERAQGAGNTPGFLRRRKDGSGMGRARERARRAARAGARARAARRASAARGRRGTAVCPATRQQGPQRRAGDREARENATHARREASLRAWRRWGERGRWAAVG
jgi:hypothetical protein